MKSLPSDFSPRKVAVLDLSESKIEQLWSSRNNKVCFIKNSIVIIIIVLAELLLSLVSTTSLPSIRRVIYLLNRLSPSLVMAKRIISLVLSG